MGVLTDVARTRGRLPKVNSRVSAARAKPMIIWSSEKGSMVDALALSDEEGRGKLRKARVRSKHPLIPG
jgi:hypothetical protein